MATQTSPSSERTSSSSKEFEIIPMVAKKEKLGSLTRITVGSKNESQTNKTILLVGETGAGKSTLINALVNYSMGTDFDNNTWFQIVEEEDQSQAESQTSDVIVYQIFGFEGKTLPYSLTIIDTPGFGDTRGIEHDVIISQRLLDLFRSEDGVHEINAVGLVVKASDNRLSDRLMYVLNSVTSVFGKDLEKKTVALITHSDGEPPKALLKALEAARDEKNQPVYFLFNNEMATDKARGDLRTIWDKKMNRIGQFSAFIENTTPQKMVTTLEVVNECIRLAACIQNLQDRINLTELKQTEIRQIQEAVKKNEEKMKKNQNVPVEVDEVYKDKEPIDGGRRWLMFFEAAVCCTVCKETCHYPGCTMAQSPESCEVMKDGRCTVCTRKCPASDHVKENQRYVNKTKRVQKTRKEIKENYEKYDQDGENKKSVLENLEGVMKKLTAEKSQLLDEAYQRVVSLEQIALNVDSVSTYVHLDFLIEKMKEEGDTEKVQKLEEMKRTEDAGIRAMLQHKLTNCSSKYKQFITKSGLVRSGSPDVYQLRTKTEKFENLIRMTVGEKDVNIINKTILLVGETGAGKSTLINALVNYSMGVKWEDGVWFQIVEEGESCAGSQTSDVMVYQIFGFEGKTLPYSLTIIDTPGFGDTRGIEYDVLISQRLLDLFRSDDGVNEINAVGMVMKGTDNRLSDRLSYVFNSVTSLFGKNLEKNIVALITHSNGRNPKDALQALKVAKIKCSRNKKDQPVYFLFDNRQHEDQTEEEKEEEEEEEEGEEEEEEEEMISLKHSDKISKRGIKRFTSFLEKSEPHKLGKTVEVLNERIRLTACIQNLQDRINLAELKQTEIKQIKEALKMYQEMKKNQNFIVEVDEPYKDKEPIDGGMWWLVFYRGAVTCKVCEENCHYPGCTMARKPAHCEVIKDDRCTVCTNKCPASDHVKEKWRYVTKTRKVQKTLKGIKEMNEENKSEGDEKKNMMEKLEEEMKKLTSEKSQLLDEAYQHVMRLEEIALNVVSVSTYVHLDILIEKMKEEGDTEKAQKLEEMKWREDKGIRAALQYVWGKLKRPTEIWGQIKHLGR